MDEQVSLLIDRKLFAYWSDLEIKLSIDSFDTVGFSAPFEPDRQEFRETFRPFSFKPIQVLVAGEPIFTGTMVGVDPDFDATGKRVAITAYAQPGVLGDCTAPTGFGHKGRSASGAVKLEFTKLTLAAIAAQLCEPFGIEIEFRDPPGAPFEKVAIKIEEKIHSFLAELAKQRGLVMTNNSDGGLLFWQSVGRQHQAPVAQLVEGVPPLTGVKATFSPQEYYSEITGFAAAKHRKGGSRYTYRNPFLGAGLDGGTDPINTFRPMSCKFDDTERGDAPDATKAKVGRMFANMAAFATDEMPGWRDRRGKIWDPNRAITLLAPSAMVYRETEMLIREVTLRQSKDKESAQLNLVLPGAFSGEIPERLPWSE